MAAAALRAIHGDITRVKADAIVNAANSRLVGGGGVDGAIHLAAGPSVMAELDVIRAARGECPPGKAVVTGAGKLNARYIFHAVGPVYRGGGLGEPELLASCYRECLQMAAARQLVSIAFPAISTGIYGYPRLQATQIAVREIEKFLEVPTSVTDVLLVFFDGNSLRTFEQVTRA